MPYTVQLIIWEIPFSHVLSTAKTCEKLQFDLLFWANPNFERIPQNRGLPFSRWQDSILFDVGEQILDCKKGKKIFVKFARVLSPPRLYQALTPIDEMALY